MDFVDKVLTKRKRLFQVKITLVVEPVGNFFF